MNSIVSASQNGTIVFKGQSQLTVALFCVAAMLVIGDIDYVTGYQTSVIVAYILPVGFAAIDVGTAFAIFLAILSMAISIGSDIWDGIPASELPILILNASIALIVFIISVGLLQELKRILLRRE